MNNIKIALSILCSKRVMVTWLGGGTTRICVKSIKLPSPEQRYLFVFFKRTQSEKRHHRISLDTASACKKTKSVKYLTKFKNTLEVF